MHYLFFSFVLRYFAYNFSEIEILYTARLAHSRKNPPLPPQNLTSEIGSAKFLGLADHHRNRSGPAGFSILTHKYGLSP